VPGLGLNASFSRTAALPGGIALVAQSGAVASTLTDWARSRGIGFSHVVTLGDMLDVDFGDMLDYLATAKETRAILLYVEGLTNARKFMSAARRAARTKPVLVVKAGRTAASAKIAASHTGALAGSDAVYDAVFARAGIMRVEDLDDLFAATELLASGAPAKGERLAVVTNGGGLGVLAADRLLRDNGKLAELSDYTLSRLSAVLPKMWSGANPVDIIGDAGPDRYAAALEAVLKDPGVDAALAIYCPTAVGDPEAIAQEVVKLSSPHDAKPVFASWTGGESVASARTLFSQRRVPSFTTPNAAVRGFMQLVHYKRLQELLIETPQATQEVPIHALQEARALLASVDRIKWLAPVDTRTLLGLYGIPCNRAAYVSTPREAADIAAVWACRIALKIVSPDIVHKSDVGGVILDVAPGEAEAEAIRLLNTVRTALPQAHIDGVLVEEMIKRRNAHELFLGMTLDPTFGPVIAFGHGGTSVEVVNDKIFGLPPLNSNLAKAMVAETRVGKLLGGYRNFPAVNQDAVINALVRLGQLAADHPQIVDLDINPLLADDQGVIAVDARVKIDPSQAVSQMIITPYPRALARTLALRDGTTVFTRPVKPQDAPLLSAFARKLSPKDLSFRFFAPMQHGDGIFAARLSQIDYNREMTLLVLPDEGSDNIFAIARFQADPDNINAEFAIAVGSDMQERGIGFAALSYLLQIARERGLTSVWGDVLSDSATMMQLVAAVGMHEESQSSPVIRRVRYNLRATI